MRNEIDSTRKAFNTSLKFEPISNGSGVGLWITFRTVRPETFTNHKISEPVSIKVGDIKGVRLRELNTITVLLWLSIYEAMHFERNGSVASLDMFEPGDTEPMRGDCCDNVVVTVAIHVVDEHLRTIKFKGPGVMFPHGVVFDRLWLFPPSLGL